MAISKDNIFMEGMSGTVARKMTMSQRAGTTVIGRKRRESSVPPTESQLQVQDRFIEAGGYAKAALLDPVLKEVYTRGAKDGQSAFNVALKDAALPAVIMDIVTVKYTGIVGSMIEVKVKNPVKVAEVKLSVISAAGVLLEEGAALLKYDAKIQTWEYKSVTANDQLPGTRIAVVVTDLPGSITRQEALIN